MLQCEKLKFGYGRPLGEVSLSVESGVLVVVGRNGGGKTAFLRTVSGLIPKLGGSLRVCGVPDPHQNPRALVGRREFLFPHPPPPFPLRFSDLGIYPRYEELFELGELAGGWVNEFSAGEFQRVMLARTLSSPARFIVLDEPEVHLDYRYRRLLWDVVMEERGERTFVLSTTFVETALTLGDLFLVLCEEGWRVAESLPSLSEVYGVSVEYERRGEKWFVGY